MFMRTLGLRIGLGLGLGLGIGLVFGFSGPTSIEGGKNFFSAPCAFISCILHVTCALLPPPPPPLPLHTHTILAKTGMFGPKTPCLCLFIAYFTYRKLGITTL